jgi:hypothetical protein
LPESVERKTARSTIDAEKTRGGLRKKEERAMLSSGKRTLCKLKRKSASKERENKRLSRERLTAGG